MLGWASLQRRFSTIIRASLSRSEAAPYVPNLSNLQRRYSSNTSYDDPSSKPTNVAVLGGGITGLASAYYLAQQLPRSQITLFEASSRLGGWLRSTQVDVGNGNVVFEQGPRNLRPTRPNGWVTLDLVRTDKIRQNQ